VNPGAREGLAVPAMLLIYASQVERKNVKIHCHLRYGYFATVNKIMMVTIELFE
jgi:hypothetical protein